MFIADLTQVASFSLAYRICIFTIYGDVYCSLYLDKHASKIYSYTRQAQFQFCAMKRGVQMCHPGQKWPCFESWRKYTLREQ